jgi:atrial natriuretic peptide receptor B
MRTACLAVAVVSLVCLAAVEGYHTPVSEIVKYPHCWPLDADDENDEPIDCGDLIMEWVDRPNDLKYVQGDVIYLAVNITSTDIESNESQADLCKKDCPSDCNATLDDCCVRLATVVINCVVHSDEDVCVPWKSDNVFISEISCGPFGSYNASVVLYVVGVNVLFYYAQVGNISIVLADYIDVAPIVCGDGECQGFEDCTYCAVDCCETEYVLVALAIFIGGILCITLIPAVSITISIAVCIYHRKRKRMKDESWIISYSDIVTNPGKRAMLPSLNKRKGSPAISLGSSLDLKAQQVFTETGAHNGKTVAIRRVRSTITGYSGISSQIRKQVVQIRYLEHKNLCKFIGATLRDPPPNIAIISEYCSKGSLNDVLLNEDVPLTWNFRLSFAKDIARGMTVLHSHGIAHGRLTSSNCVIDERWVTKVTDYGLPALRCSGEEDGEEAGEQLRNSIPKVYRAPEVRHLPLRIPSSSPPADVYSFAIILYEIATGMDPRSEISWQLDTNFKPKINQGQLNSTECPCSKEYLNLINKCWTFSPQTRPLFDRVKRELKQINPSKTSAIDNMMLLMEKYSKHLETLVNERTAELEVEKEKATDLLYRMIPQAVAEELKNGKMVNAEEFEGVTIFFSDIVGFTTLAGDSSPMQIVELLNNLYTEFDQVLDQFDVYKVETIGDAYMVVSGVPRPNGDRHAGEIAKMALELVACCETFTIPHKPGTRLQIRAGIHSGSVCAGIVGKKMPRYCLFGDTVNTASRMESNSKAMSIQCSDTTYKLLDKLGGFTLESRGEISIKGKGTMNTWWLKGYTEPDIVILPPPREDTPTSPTTKEPIRDAPKKFSSLGEKYTDTRTSTSSLPRGLSSTTLDVYKRHQSLQTSSFSNLLSAVEGERLCKEKTATSKRSVTIPREISSSKSTTELPQTTQPTTPAHRFSVPQITVSTFASGVRRVTQPNVETVGLGSSSSSRAREPGNRNVSRTSVTSREHPLQMTVAPLDCRNETEL